jgi:adenine-specific DNA-methyltransferase
MNDSTTDDIQSVQGTTPDFKTEFAKQLSELAPELVTDGKIDGKKLQELLDGDEADDSERFGLFWPGKKRAMRAAQEPTTATLKPVKEESKDWDTTQNLFIEGDNLEVLKVLQKHYHNKIKMIYIDPPYNTGKDFVYPDNYKEGLASYLEFTNQVDNEGRKVSTNSDTDGRYHSNWLNMMYPRLKLARNLLTDDGVIFISIDDHELANLHRIANEIFGEDNYLGTITRSTGTPTGGGNDVIVGMADYIIVYARSSRVKIYGTNFSEKAASIYDKEDDKGKYLTRTLRRTGGEDRREDRPSMFYPVTAPDGTEIYPIGPTGYESRWICGLDTFKRMESEGLIEWVKTKNGWNVHQKFYLEGRTIQPSNLWTDVEGNKQATRYLRKLFDDKKLFDHPKPVALIQRMIEIATKHEPNAIVLDFFSGSGTTAEAVIRQNIDDNGHRSHIQVQLPEPIDEESEAGKAGYRTIATIATERIRRSGEKIKVDYSEKITGRSTPLDVGFKVYRLTESNFTKWQSQSDTDKDSLQQHLLDIRESSNDAASEEDLLTEVLLKQGISLTAPISHDEVDGLSVWTVGDNLVCAYLNEKQKPNLDQLRAIAAKEPAKLIILEDAFQGDDELKTNLHQICKSQKIELWTV